MSLFCRNKALNPMQRRFGVLFSTTLLFTALLYLLSTHAAHNGSTSPWKPAIFLLPAIPFLVMMLLIPRYLRQEKDEFVRALVMRSLLWGFAIPMLVDTIWGFLSKLWPLDTSLLPMLNIDLFCIAALLALAIQVRRYQ